MMAEGGESAENVDEACWVDEGAGGTGDQPVITLAIMEDLADLLQIC